MITYKYGSQPVLSTSEHCSPTSSNGPAHHDQPAKITTHAINFIARCTFFATGFCLPWAMLVQIGGAL